MIYTVTFNPALDYVMRVPEYRTGHVNRSCEEELFPGGKGINVSRVLKSLGYESVALGFLAGETGKFIEAMLCRMGIRTDFVRLEKGNSRINVKLKSREETEINAQGPEPSEKEKAALFEKLRAAGRGDIVILSGSVQKDVGNTIYADIMKSMANRGVRFIVDASGDLLLNTLALRPFLVKPNREELEELFGEKAEGAEKITELAAKLQHSGAENVLVSLGKDGAVLVCGNGKVFLQKAPEGAAVNSTGAGDSTVAGFVAGYGREKNFEYALKLGVASGSATAFSDDIAERETIEKTYRDVENVGLIQLR